MARHTRIVIPGQVHHIVHRGNNGQTIFFSEKDYDRFLDVLLESARASGCSVHAYVLMQNHIHLLVTPMQEDSLSTLVQGIGRKYVRYINRSYNRSGTLWEGRFKSAIIDADNYLLPCSQYIEGNPVRAGLVKQVEAYRWSSYHTNALGRVDDLIEPHAVYQRLGDDLSSCVDHYRQRFTSPQESNIAALIREKTHQGGVIGNSRFQRQIDNMFEGRISRFKHGGDRRSKIFIKTSQMHQYADIY